MTCHAFRGIELECARRAYAGKLNGKRPHDSAMLDAGRAILFTTTKDFDMWHGRRMYTYMNQMKMKRNSGIFKFKIIKIVFYFTIRISILTYKSFFLSNASEFNL